MASENSLRLKARQLRRHLRARDELPAKMIEVENEDSTTSVRVSGLRNMVWILLYDEDARVTQAYNVRTQVRANAPVWVRRMPDNTLVITGIRELDGTELYADAAPSINVPPLIGELMPETVWPSRNLLPGRIRWTTAGGLLIYIEPFHYDGGYFPGGTLDLTAYVPSVANKKAWVKVWVNPNAANVNAMPGATAGSNVDLSVNPMSEADLAAITISPSYIPVAGIVLTNGDTAITSTTLIADARQWINAPQAASQFMPYILATALTIPAAGQIAVRRMQVAAGGTLTVLGILDIF